LVWVSIVALVVILFVTGIVFLKKKRSRYRGVQMKKVSLSEIDNVYQQITRQAKETSFAVLIISPRDWDPELTVEIQFSVERGITGLDWILMSESNIREKPRVIEYASAKGKNWHEQEMNNWIYLRMEDEGLVDFCKSLISDLYAVEDVVLKYGGFLLK